jgi:tetratricopeptide (TPR) repeat protein
MRLEPDRRSRDAGFLLVAACENVLGVRGPTAVAKLTGRSKSWWSKLAAGTVPFPAWKELERLLPAELGQRDRQILQARYRRAWLGLYDPELQERLDSPVPMRATLGELYALLHTAGAMGYERADPSIALRLQGMLERLLVSRGIPALSSEELFILRECLDHQSICHGELGDYAESIATARRSIQYQRAGGSHSGELYGRHVLGLAYQRVDGLQRARSLGKAVAEFESLSREYRRWGMSHELIRARRDIGITKLALGRPEEGEAELIQAYEVPRVQSGEDQFETARWLAEASLRRGNVAQARRWLAQLQVIRRRYPQEIARLMTVGYITHHLTQLEGQLVAPPPPRKR